MKNATAYARSKFLKNIFPTFGIYDKLFTDEYDKSTECSLIFLVHALSTI